MTRAVRSYLGLWAGIFVLAAIGALISRRTVVFASTMLFLTGLAHSVLGERFILGRVFRAPEMPRLLGSTTLMRQTVRFAWHQLTVAWWGSAAILIASARDSFSGSEVLRILSITFAISALVSGIATRGRHLSWAAFAAIALATWFAVPALH